MPIKQRTCKRRKVRINSDGYPNKHDVEHNKKCEQKYMLIDNPWMKSVLNKKNPKGYNKYLKHVVKKRIKTLQKKPKKSRKNKSRKNKSRKNKSRKNK